jgi:hypothetical protein
LDLAHLRRRRRGGRRAVLEDRAGRLRLPGQSGAANPIDEAARTGREGWWRRRRRREKGRGQGNQIMRRREKKGIFGRGGGTWGGAGLPVVGSDVDGCDGTGVSEWAAEFVVFIFLAVDHFVLGLFIGYVSVQPPLTL